MRFACFGYWWRCKGIDRPTVQPANHLWPMASRHSEVGTRGRVWVCRVFSFALTYVFQFWLLITIENELCTRLFHFVTICRPPQMLSRRFCVCVWLLKYFNHHKSRWSDIKCVGHRLCVETWDYHRKWTQHFFSYILFFVR